MQLSLGMPMGQSLPFAVAVNTMLTWPPGTSLSEVYQHRICRSSIYVPFSLNEIFLLKAVNIA